MHNEKLELKNNLMERLDEMELTVKAVKKIISEAVQSGKEKNTDLFVILHEFLDGVERLAWNLRKLVPDIAGMERLGERVYPSEKEACEIVDKFETAVWRIREVNLKRIATMPERRTFLAERLRNDAAIMGVTLASEDCHKTLHIHYPALLPHRKANDYSNSTKKVVVSADIVREVLWEYMQSEDFHASDYPFEDTVIVVCEGYRYQNSVRDNSNLNNVELKRVVDALAPKIIQSDDSIHCTVHMYGRLAEENCTDIFVMKKENFTDWLNKHDR